MDFYDSLLCPSISFDPSGPMYKDMTHAQLKEVADAIQKYGQHVQIIAKGYLCYKRYTLEKLDAKAADNVDKISQVLKAAAWKNEKKNIIPIKEVTM